MARSLVVVNGVTGSYHIVPIGVAANVSNSGEGGETSILWFGLTGSQPSGTYDGFSNSTSFTPTFTPNKEGNYLLHNIVNEDASLTSSFVLSVRHLKSGIESPAAGEKRERSGSYGWALAQQENNTAISDMMADKGLWIGFANEAMEKGHLVRLTGSALLKVGLPGEERVGVFEKAQGEAATTYDESMFVVVGSVTGSATSVTSGSLVQVRSYGFFGPITGSLTVGSKVYPRSDAVITGSNEISTRELGHVIETSGSSFWIAFNGVAAGGTNDHGSLQGLADDDHTQYLLADGTRAFSGPLQSALVLTGHLYLNNTFGAGQTGRSLYVGEQTSADTDFATYGQLWSKYMGVGNPPTLWYTDDDGTDAQVITSPATATLKTKYWGIEILGDGLGDGIWGLIGYYLTFTDVSEAINYFDISNATTGSGPILASVGGQDDIHLNLLAKGTGNINLGVFSLDADQSIGAGQDSYVLTYDNTTGLISLEATTSILEIQHTGSTLTTSGSILNLTGSGGLVVSGSVAGGVVTIDISGSGLTTPAQSTDRSIALWNGTTGTAITGSQHILVDLQGNLTASKDFVAQSSLTASNDSIFQGAFRIHGTQYQIPDTTRTGTFAIPSSNTDEWFIPIETSGSAWTITLPAASADGAIIKIADIAGSCSLNNLTIEAASGDIVFGVSSSLALTQNWACITLHSVSDGAWIIEAGQGYTRS